MSPRPVAQSQARGGSADELQEVQITARYVGPGMEAANARLDNNPVNSIYQPAAVMTPDEARAMEEIVVEDRRIYGGEDVGLDLYNYLWHTTPGTYKERQQRLAALENSTTNRYLARQESIAGRPLVPNSTWNQAIADEFHRVGGPKEFGAFGSLEREALRDYGRGTGPNAVSGTLMNWMGAVDDWALSQHDKGAAMYERGDYLGAMQAAFGTFGTDFAAHLGKGVLGLGVLATDTDAQLSLMRRTTWAIENPGHAGDALLDAFSGLSTREKQFALIDTYTGLRALGVDPLPSSLTNPLAEALAQFDVRFPLVPVGAGEAGMFGIKGVQSPIVRRPDPTTGAGYGPNDPPVRIQGEWTDADLQQALLGYPPRGLGSPDLHHAGQMPGSGIHEVVSAEHRNNPALHPNRFNQGVTPEMREADRRLHWWYRAREQGADERLPGWIYD